MRFTFGNNSLLLLQLKKCLANVWRIPCPLVPSRPTFAKAKVCGSTTPEAALVWRDMRLTRQLKNAKPVLLEGSNTRPETAPVSCAQLTLKPSSKDLSSAGRYSTNYHAKYLIWPGILLSYVAGSVSHPTVPSDRRWSFELHAL